MAIAPFLKRIAEPRCVREQMADRDDRNRSIGQARLKVGQEARHWIVQPHNTILDQAHHGGGDKGFGHRCKSENAIRLHRLLRFTVCKSRRAAIGDLAAPGDDHDRSHQTIVGESIVYRAIQAIGHIRAFKG